MEAADPKLLEPSPDRKLLPAPQRGPSRRKLLLMGGGLLLLLLILFLVGYLPRHKREQKVQAAAQRQAQALPSVNVTPVHRSPGTNDLLLPGNMAPLQEAYIYARAMGYVAHRYADIGDLVKKDQVLAEIDAPDLDAQVDQARATLAQAERQLVQATAALENAQAQQELARVTWERYNVLVQHGAVSRQDADQQLANYRTAQANVHLQEAGVRAAEENVHSNRANLDRLIALQSFKLVRAPYAGVITARNFDVGAYVSGSGATSGQSTTPLGGTQASGSLGNAGANGSTQPSQINGPNASNPTTPGIGNSGELYHLAQIDVLRILINVPQENASTIRAGQSASLFVAQFSKRTFAGKVTRTTNALDPVARTLLTEVDVQNRERLLMPGMYAQVKITDNHASRELLVPATPSSKRRTASKRRSYSIPLPSSARSCGAGRRKPRGRNRRRVRRQQKSGQQAAEQQQFALAKRVHLQKVEVGRDYGPQIEVTNGLDGWEYVVVNPGDAVQEGALVVPRPAPQVLGQGNPQRQGQSEKQPSGIGPPVMAAPTQAPPKAGKSGGKGGSGKGGQNGKGAQKGGGQ